MGNANEKPDFKELAKGTKFSSSEIQAFFTKFKKDFPHGMINKAQFETLYKKMFGAEGDAKEFCDLVFDQYDKDHSGVVDFKEFVLTLSVAARGSAEEKLLWAFKLYDNDGNGYLTEAEIVKVLTTVYKAKSKPNPGEAAKEEAKNVIQRTDDNKDGRVSEAEFIHHAKNSKNLKELLQVL